MQVVGVPDQFFSEELLAVVILKAGEQLTEQELRDYCTGQISHQKIPRYVQFVESYPLTASGKVQKFVLRERAMKALGLEEVANGLTGGRWNVRYADGRYARRLPRNDGMGALQDENTGCDNATGRHPLL